MSGTKHRILEIAGLRESGLPSQQQIAQSNKNAGLFKKADKAHKDLLKFLQKWDRAVGDDDPTPKQLADIEKAVKIARKDFEPFLSSDSNAIITHGTAAQKLYKNITTQLNNIDYMLRGD